MDKMKLQTPGLVAENVEKIAELFPNCVTETKGADGKPRKAINFDMLRQMLSDHVVEGDEAYEFTWVGKKAAIVEANRPIRRTLRPCPEESKDWNTTQNLYIEGDNLDVLKLLRESYLGQIKMIYIDPPYNTGNDFIYRDDFAMSKEDWSEENGEWSEDGERLFRNTESNGRFHSDWCSMIYSRLVIARSLLANDGVIFISIDECEIFNLQQIVREIFGVQNYVATIIWKKRSTPPNDKIIGSQHEYIICIQKNITTPGLNLRKRSEDQLKRYTNPDNHPKGPWMAGDLMANVKGGRYVDSLYFPIINPRTGQKHYPSSNGNWRFNKDKINQLIANNEIYFGENDQGRPKLKRFLCDVKEGMTWTTLWDFVPFNTTASSEMAQIFGRLSTFENPKPTNLIVELLRAGSSPSGIILDFFSGSATTAHAVMKLNAEDGGQRQYIMVQLQETCPEDSEAAKAGFKNICELGKERIRRVGDKIKAELEAHGESATLDIGFRVFKVDESNMKDVYYTPGVVKQGDLRDLISNIKEDRTDLDLLFGCLLDWGLPLSLPYSSEKIGPCTVHTYNEGDLVACFDENIPENVIREIASRKPLRAVFRDSGFTDDPAKINVLEIFKHYMPESADDIRKRVKVI